MREGSREGGTDGVVGRRGRTGGREDGREGGWEGGKEGFRHEGPTHCSGPGMVMHISMPVAVSIHSAMTCWREGLRAVGR